MYTQRSSHSLFQVMPVFLLRLCLHLENEKINCGRLRLYNNGFVNINFNDTSLIQFYFKSMKNNF